MHDRILKNPTEGLSLDFYHGECELGFLVLKLGHDHSNRFYHFKYIARN